MDVSIDDKIYQSTIEIQEYVGGEKIEMIEAIKDLFTLNLLYYQLTSNIDERKSVEKTLWVLVNKWLEHVSPLKYIPGLAEELGDTITRKIWELNDLPEELIEDLLVNTYLLKEGYVEVDFAKKLFIKIRDSIRELVVRLGGDPSKGVLGELLNGNSNSEPSDLATIAALTLVVSTNC